METSDPLSSLQSLSEPRTSQETVKKGQEEKQQNSFEIFETYQHSAKVELEEKSSYSLELCALELCKQQRQTEFFKILSGSIDSFGRCSVEKLAESVEFSMHLSADAFSELPTPRPLKAIYSTASGTGSCTDPFIINGLMNGTLEMDCKIPDFIQELGDTHPLTIAVVSKDSLLVDLVRKQLFLLRYFSVKTTQESDSSLIETFLPE